MNSFSDIRSRNDLADFLGVKRSQLTYILYAKKIESFYYSFDIPKKTGGTRQIHAPTGILKAIQQCIAYALWEHLKKNRTEKGLRPNLSHAFEKGKSIMTNAHVHRNKRIVLNIDLEHFFESFHFGRVAGYFEKNRDFLLPHDVAIIIAQLTCFNGYLPQGGPSSPIITNLICQIFDMHILKIAKRYKLDYTRYADDLTFSTNNHSFISNQDSFMQELEAEILKSGFSINHKKTRLSLHDSQQTVTGLIVNDKVNINSDYYRQTRAMAHHLYSHGSFEINGKMGTINQIEGRFSFINQIDRYNNQKDGERHSVHTLNGREKQYQAFLYYKYFYSNSKPLIVTEGKTDARYIKAALKSLWTEYPQLIEKKKNGAFQYKFTILHKTERLTYFMGIAQDGADTMKNIYSYYNDDGNKHFPNYYSKLSKLRIPSDQQPVILLFDNEMCTGKKPLSHFVNHIKLETASKTKLKSNLYLRLLPESNLYLMTVPLVNGKDECEIEDLFQPQTREHKIGSRTLCLKDKYDPSKYYGKEEFSNYVTQNYASIDFSGFRKLLDTLSTLLKQHNSNEPSKS